MTITEVFTLFVAGVSLYIAWRKAPFESKHLDAQAAEKYQSIAVNAADRLDKLEAKVNELTQRAQAAEDRASKFENWAKRLSGQVVSMGGIPVLFEQSEAKR
jgi:predicted nuclease with TOPRIM domain